MDSLKLCISAALLMGLTLTGCSDGAAGAAKREKVSKVSGKVTMAGAPVASAIVTFSPGGKQPAANGRTDAEGKYTLTTYDPGDGAAPGDYTVLVTKEGASATSAMPTGHDPTGAKPVDSAAMHSAQKVAGPTGLLPSKYSAATSSDLKVTVKDGDNDIPLELKP